MSQNQTTEDSAPPADFRAGFVAIVGRPNVGKSTLVNKLVGERVAITTPKPQTTRDRIRGIRTWDDWQAVYVDTPGIHEAKTLLHRYMVELAVGTLGDADLVYFLVDVAHFESKPEKVLEQTQAIVEALSQAGTTTFLVLNKVDHLKDKSVLLPMIEQLSALYPFAETVPISALKGEGIETLCALTRPHLPESPPLFPEDSLTDRSMRFIAAELIREQLYRRLRQELPYQVAVSVDHWEETIKTESVKIYATIHVSRDGHKGIVIGHKGETLKAIGQSARKGIEAIMERRLYLDLKVRVQDKWPNDPRALQKLGYGETT